MNKILVTRVIVLVVIGGILWYVRYKQQSAISGSAASTSTTTKSSKSTVPKDESPLSIAYMRRQTYPGSEITIEETLSPGSNYDRYVASYKSDGLKIYGLLTVPHGDRPKTGWPVVIFNHGYIPPAEYHTHT